MPHLYTLQDIWDDYADGGEERAIANILGEETEESELSDSVNISPIMDTSTSPTSTILFTKLPFEIRSQILEGFLPSRNSILKATLRNHQRTSLQLPAENKKTLVPLLLVSKSLSADLITLILSRCKVIINHDSSSRSLKLLKESSLFNSPGNGFGLACLRKMEVSWTPQMKWDAEDARRICELLKNATGLVELKFTIPMAWWKEDAKKVWKGGLRMTLANAPNLGGIELERYQPVTDCHPGWQSCVYRLGGSQWLNDSSDDKKLSGGEKLSGGQKLLGGEKLAMMRRIDDGEKSR